MQSTGSILFYEVAFDSLCIMRHAKIDDRQAFPAPVTYLLSLLKGFHEVGLSRDHLLSVRDVGVGLGRQLRVVTLLGLMQVIVPIHRWIRSVSHGKRSVRTT